MPSRVTIERLGNPRLAQIAADSKSLEGVVTLMVGLGKELCPVRDGPLRNSVMGRAGTEAGVFETGFNESGKDPAPVDQKLDLPVSKNMGVVGTASDHWYPEFGTRYQPAQPFMRPAAEFIISRKSAIDIVARYCREEMERQFKFGIRQFTYYKSGEAVPPGLRA